MNNNNIKENIVTEFANAFWTNEAHTMFHVDVTMSDSSIIPFTYVVDGSDDNDGPISVAVRNAFHNNEIQIHEYPESLQLLSTLRKITAIRNYRNDLLSLTDKYMTIDYPITDESKNALKIYRQALRDLPQQDGFPDNVVWPEKPEIVKL